MGRITEAVKNLIIINVIFYVATFYIFDKNTMFEWFALYYPSNPNFRIWQVVTHMFMHGGFWHILLNMYALWAFGSPLEQMWGKSKFLFFYFSAGLGAAAVYTLANYFNQDYNAVAVGASGAIYGVLVAFGMAFPNAKLGLIFFPIPIAAKYFIPLLILSDLIFGFTGNSNIAHFAHVGGALTGFLMMQYWKKTNLKDGIRILSY